MNRMILAAALAALLSGCAYDGYDSERPGDGRGGGDSDHQGKPGENKLAGTRAPSTGR